MALTAEQRSQRARIAALERWSREDPQVQASRGQSGLLDRFRRDILVESPGLVDPELTRRAEARRRAHMQRLAVKSAAVRSARRTAS